MAGLQTTPAAIGLALTSFPIVSHECAKSRYALKASAGMYDASIMHTAVSSTLLTYVVLIDASPTEIAQAFAVSEPEVLSSWVTTRTPLPRISSAMTAQNGRTSCCPRENEKREGSKAPFDPKVKSVVSCEMKEIASMDDLLSLNRSSKLVKGMRMNISSVKHKSKTSLAAAMSCSEFFALLESRLNALKVATEDEGGEFFGCARSVCICPNKSVMSSVRCGWFDDKCSSPHMSTGRVRFNECGTVVSRMGDSVYCGARLNSVVNVDMLHAQSGKIAAYLEFEIIVGGGICIGIGLGEGSLHKLIGADDDGASVGFQENGCLVQGSGPWTPHCAPFRSGDIVSILICAAEYKKESSSSSSSSSSNSSSSSGIFRGNCSSSAVGSIVSGDDDMDVPCASLSEDSGGVSAQQADHAAYNLIRHKLHSTAASSSAKVLGESSKWPLKVTFFVNGIAGCPVLLHSAPRLIYGRVSLYGKDARVRARCCEKSWRHFPQAARVARPACLVSPCSSVSTLCEISVGRRSNSTIITESVQSTKLPANSRPVTVLRSKSTKQSTSSSSQRTSCYSLLTP